MEAGKPKAGKCKTRMNKRNRSSIHEMDFWKSLWTKREYVVNYWTRRIKPWAPQISHLSRIWRAPFAENPILQVKWIPIVWIARHLCNPIMTWCLLRVMSTGMKYPSGQKGCGGGMSCCLFMIPATVFPLGKEIRHFWASQIWDPRSDYQISF